jgi:predicted O-methyltransferase YrrM
MSDVTLNFTPELYHYFQRNSLREPEVLAKLREQTHKMSMSQMQISPEQGQFMGFLMEVMGARKTLEVGVFTGYSALAVALALPADGKVVACDINVEWTKIAQKYWQMAGMSDKIDLRLAPALETLDSLLLNGGADTFDFAFIDADKANYINYYEKTLQLVRVGGVIAIDNTLWSGKVANDSIHDKDTVIIRELNAILVSDKRITLSMVPIGDGLSLARRRF